MRQFNVLIVGAQPNTTVLSVPVDGWRAVLRLLLQYVRKYGVENINRVKIDCWTAKGGNVLQHGNDRQTY